MKKCLLSELLHLDMREGMQVLTQEDRARRVVIKAEINYLASLEKTSWRQKSKALFLFLFLFFFFFFLGGGGGEGSKALFLKEFFHKIMEVKGVLYEDE